jgi:phosphate transport system protein
VEADPDIREPDGGDGELRELRRAYHDRIAELRAKTISIVDNAGRATEHATDILMDPDSEAGSRISVFVAETSAQVEEVDSEVLRLLALQAPVARDLRIILASRDIAQIGDLCLGLDQTLAKRIVGARDVLSAQMRDTLFDIGSATSGLLLQANGAWTTLDVEQADSVAVAARDCRHSQRQFQAALVRLSDLPVDAAVNLGMVSRVYERLTDHSLEIAARVVFAANGTPAGHAIRMEDS